MNLRWNRKLPTGEALEQKAKRLAASLHETFKGDGPPDEPELQSRVRAVRREQQSVLVNTIRSAGIVFTLLLILALASWSGWEQSKRESKNNLLIFERIFNSGGSKIVMEELDTHGNLNDIRIDQESLNEAIEDFLYDYELLSAAYQKQLVYQDMAYDAFSYHLEKALQDKTIRGFIADSRTEDPEFYEGVFKLAGSFGIKFDPIPTRVSASKYLKLTPTEK